MNLLQRSAILCAFFYSGSQLVFASPIDKNVSLGRLPKGTQIELIKEIRFDKPVMWTDSETHFELNEVLLFTTQGQLNQFVQLAETNCSVNLWPLGPKVQTIIPAGTVLTLSSKVGQRSSSVVFDSIYYYRGYELYLSSTTAEGIQGISCQSFSTDDLTIEDFQKIIGSHFKIVSNNK